MKLARRFICVLLCMALLVSLVACGDNGERGQGTTPGGSNNSDSDPIEIVVYSQLANFSGEQVGWAAEILKEKFNVVIKIIPDADGVFDTRMEAGNLGDIVVFGGVSNDYYRAVQNGMLLDWNKNDMLSKNASYIKENMPYALAANQELTSTITEGKSNALYGFGHNVATSSEDHEEFFYTWDVRWDLYKQLGYPVVKSLDDLVTLFEQMKQICPKDDNGNQTYAVSLWPDWDGSMVMYVKAFATAFWGYDELEMGIYDPDTGVMHDALEENGPYLQSLKFFNTLYQKGLLDPNSMTQTWDGMAEKVKAGGTFFSIFNYAGSLLYNSDDHLSAGKYMYSLVPQDAVPLTYGMSVYGGTRIWTIGAQTENPELCLQIINYLSTPEGLMTMEYGPQGVTWDYDENHQPYLTEVGKATRKSGDTEFTYKDKVFKWKDGTLQINNTTWSLNAVNPETNGKATYNYQLWESTTSEVAYDIQKDWIDYTGYDKLTNYFNSLNYKVSPATKYAGRQKSDEFDVIWNQVKDCIVKYSWQAIYAKSDAEFNYLVKEMIKKANAYGYDQCKQWSKDEAEIRHQLELEVTNKK